LVGRTRQHVIPDFDGIERNLCRALQVQPDKETKKKLEVTESNTAREKKIVANFITYSNINKPTPQSNEGCA